MDILLKIMAVLWIILLIIEVGGYPFLIGKPKTGTYTAFGFFLVALIMSIPMLLVGRILGWW